MSKMYNIQMYRTLSPDRIIETARTLKDRISERLPGSGLYHVSEEVLSVAEGAAEVTAAIEKPHWPLRIGTWVAVIALVVTVPVLIIQAHPVVGGVKAGMEVDRFVQATEAAINISIILGSAIFFMVTLEGRIKRNRALRAIHELRSLAHVIDMHQLTKDPHRLLMGGADTKSSPERRMDEYTLSRYLNYGSELLSIIGKLAALYAQSCKDGVVLEAVDAMEDLTLGISQKIWQKLRMLGHLPERQ